MNSDLRFAGGDFLVGFGGGSSEAISELVDSRGQRLSSGQTLQVWGLFAQDAEAPLRWPLREAAGAAIRILDDPLSLFLDQLVEAPISLEVAGALRAETHSFLLPFRSEILDWFPPSSSSAVRVIEPGAPPARNAASVVFRPTDREVELWIPVQRNWFIRATKRYETSAVLQAFLPRLAVWPDFESSEWRSYFYYRGGTISTDREEALTLDPRFPAEPLERSRQHGAHWWRSASPAEALVASDLSLRREAGLLLGPFAQQMKPPPLVEWRLSVDLGSTHTRLFFITSNGATPQPLEIQPRAVVLTGLVQGGLSDQEFFRAKGHLPLEELPTQIVIPVHPDGARPSEISPANWLPADGVAVLGQVHRDFLFDSQVRLFTEVKWHLDLQASDPAAVFLSHILLLAQAEAFVREAKITEVGYSHPSAFPPLLVDNFEQRWRRLLPEKNGGPRNGRSEVEAFSVMKYLADAVNASPTALLLAIDIGGSTSDIAIWRANRCHTLESIRFAASAISAYLCLDQLWNHYRGRLAEFGLKEKAPSIQDALLTAKRHERLPLLYATLNFLEGEERLDEIQIRFHHELTLRPFLTHCSYIYGALFYYLGMLAREVASEDEGEEGNCVIYLCGKGAKFFSWLQREGLRSGLEEVFQAGLKGPGGTMAPMEVRFVLSRSPKWEVGYGRLVTHADDGGRHWFEPWGQGRDFLEQRPVRVGEAGYTGLSPLDALDLACLKSLASSGPSAVPKRFQEFEHFLGSWQKAVYSLRPASLPRGFHGALVERLMGRVQGSIGYELADDQRALRLSLEPLFITQCKVFYELTAGVPQSLWYGRLPEGDRR